MLNGFLTVKEKVTLTNRQETKSCFFSLNTIKDFCQRVKPKVRIYWTRDGRQSVVMFGFSQFFNLKICHRFYVAFIKENIILSV